VLPAVGLTIYLSYSRAGAAAVTIAVLAALAFGVNRWTTAAHALVAGAGTGLAILAVRNEDQIAHATGSAGAGTVLAVLVIAAASCAALAVITKLWSLDDFRLSPRAGGIATVVTVLAAILIGFTVASEPISNGWDQFRHERTPVATNDPAARLTTLSGNRYDAWTSAIHAFHTDEWGGIGPGSFEFFWARDGDPQYARDAHSLYLENLAELGIPGLLVVIALLAALLTAAVQARVRLVRDAEIGAAAGAIAAFVVFLFFAGVDWMWELSAIGALALGGIAVAGTGGFMRWGRGEMPVAPRVALVVVAVACAVLQVPGLSATERLRDSGAALDAGDLERAKSLADDAADAEPWATSPLMQRAVVEQSLGDFASARKDLDKAVSREPMNWRLPFLLADLEAAEGHPAAVRRQLEELRRLAPHSIFLLPGSPERRRIDSVLGLTSSG
jgi:O-antigen ligase